MSETYIGRAAEAAARAKHNRIHKPMSTKRTAKKKTAAKKQPTKQAKAFTEALASFKAPEPLMILESETESLSRAISDVVMTPQTAMEGHLVADAYPYYGPPGGEEIDATFDTQEEALEASGGVLEPSQPDPGHTVPQAALDASQGSTDLFHKAVDRIAAKAAALVRHDEKLGQSDAKPRHHLSNAELSGSIEELIDGLNFLHRHGHLRKLAEKDVAILKARIKRGRELIQQLRA